MGAMPLVAIEVNRRYLPALLFEGFEKQVP